MVAPFLSALDEITFPAFQMSSLEYSWNLRRGTLNLDTRRNIMFGTVTSLPTIVRG
jgi:hypothetical protein